MFWGMVWGNCSNEKFQEMECIHIKAARIIKKVPRNMHECETQSTAKWPDLAYIYKIKEDKGRKT